MLIKNNKIYVSYEKKVKDKCFTNAILVSNLEFEKIIFNEFFNINECQPSFESSVGGNLSDFKDNKILMTIGDYKSYEHPAQGNNNPQNINSLNGKIISIDEKTKEYKILSMGHRNPQGLYYDKENNVIYSTDHGPQGGDEINVNTSPDGEIKNYGWGISSYGEHYCFPDCDNEKGHVAYKMAPLNKSHTKYGFIEPIKYFTPSIAPTQIIKTEKFIKIVNKNIIYVGALGYGYNADLIASKGLPVPTSWADLTNPVYKGEIQMANPNSSGTAYTTLATILQIFGEEEGWEYMKKLHLNISQYTKSGSAPIKAAGRGENTIGICFQHDGVKQAVKGLPITVVSPSEGTGYEVGSMSIIEGARNPEEAKQFFDWALSAEIQTLVFTSGTALQVPANKNAQADPNAPDVSTIKLIDYDFATYGNKDKRAELLSKWDNEVSVIPR